MFDIGFFELLLIAILGLLILGPERLPQAVRTVGLWVGRIKRMASSIQQEVNDQLQLEEMRQRLAEHEKRVKDGLIRTEEEAKASLKGEPLPERASDKTEASESAALRTDTSVQADDQASSASDQSMHTDHADTPPPQRRSDVPHPAQPESTSDIGKPSR